MPRPLLAALLLAALAPACIGGRLGSRRPRLDGRIVGGSEARIEDYPYQLSLEVSGSHSCGAALISDRWALTAAHCAEGAAPSRLALRAGSSRRGSGGWLRRAERAILHPQYDPYSIDCDLALVRAAEPFPLGQAAVRAVPPAESAPAAGAAVAVSGWGALREGGLLLPKQLQAVWLQVVDHDECDRAYAAYGGITSHMLCAGVPQGGKDACQGDSGGSLVADGRLVGIVSWGIGCARRNYPGVNTDVASLRAWIREQAGV